jgi:Flp pilus assembly protein TadG
MVEVAARVLRRLRAFCADRRGGVVTTFTLMALVLISAGGAALDYTNLVRVRADLQSIADTSALAAAREFRLGNADATTIAAVAQTHAGASLAAKNLSAGVEATADIVAKMVTVTLTGTVKTYVMSIAGVSTTKPKAVGVAKVVGGAPICVIALDTSSAMTTYLQKSAHLEAPGCSVYSNSKNSSGLVVQDTAILKAAFTCSSGGISKVAAGTVTPDPQKDCPVLPDPLAARAPPPVGSTCDFTNVVVRDADAILSPGTYCGGLQVLASHGKTASATLKPGQYAIKDGPLLVGGNVLIRDPKNILVALDGDVTFSGTNVSFYFVTSNAKASLDKVARIAFFKSSHISLTAPKIGAMAGILFYEDRSTGTEIQHFVTSDDTRMLLGTIYLPKGLLLVDASKPVADKSAYTIVIAHKFWLSEGPTMVLNANYAATDIPVPDGVGPNASKALLWQ